MSDWNQRIIEEFRASGGSVGGVFEGAPILLLHHMGARTGKDRISPLMYQPVDGGYAVFASKAGADSNPAWLHNLMANPETKIEVGDRVVAVVARLANDEEHDRIWTKQKQDRPQFAEYERRTSRQRIPVVLLETL